MKKEKKCHYLYSEEFKTDKDALTEQELKEIFNQKLFNMIIRLEKSIIEEL